MFAGAGDFFRPVDLRKELSPATPVRPPARSGDEPQKRDHDEPQRPDVEDLSENPDGRAAAGGNALSQAPGMGNPDDSFSEDHLELSIAALFILLAGGAPPVQETGDVPSAALSASGPETHRAFDAYQRAAEALPAPAAGAFQAHQDITSSDAQNISLPHVQDTNTSRTQDAGGEIFYMLAALEKSGVRTVGVAGGQTIYTALRAQCRAQGIALAAPVPHSL